MENKFIYVYLRDPKQFKNRASSSLDKIQYLLVIGVLLYMIIAPIVFGLIYSFSNIVLFEKSLWFLFEIPMYLGLFICSKFLIRWFFDMLLGMINDIPEESLLKIEDFVVNLDLSDRNYVIVEELEYKPQEIILNNHIKPKSLSVTFYSMEERGTFLKQHSAIDSKSFLYKLLQEKHHLFGIHRERYDQFCKKTTQQENMNVWLKFLDSLIILAIFLDLLSFPFPQINNFLNTYFDIYYYPIFENIQNQFIFTTPQELIYLIFRLSLWFVVINQIGKYFLRIYTFRAFSRYSDTLCFWQILLLNIDLYNEELFRIPEAVDLCNRRINYITQVAT